MSVTFQVSAIIGPMHRRTFIEIIWRRVFTRPDFTISFSSFFSLFFFWLSSYCGNYGNLFSHISCKNFVKVTFILKSWFDEIYFLSLFGESKFLTEYFVNATFSLKKVFKSWFHEIFLFRRMRVLVSCFSRQYTAH